jgi:cell division protein FtsI (penicillin-binding protein 3)
MPSTRTSPYAVEARKKIFLLACLTLAWLAAITARLMWVQLYRYSDYIARAAKQQQRTIEVSPKRGIIYDRNGNALAMTVDVDSVFAVPLEVPDKPGTAQILASILQFDANELLARLQNPAYKNFTWVARKIDADTAARIRNLNLKGIAFQKESNRFYPKHELAAQVLGGVGMDDKGLAGIELEEDEALHGIEGRMMVSLDAKRHAFGRIEKEPEPGENLVLTIDENIQYVAERELLNAINSTHAEAGTVVVQNPKTGEILALANYPTFDPNGLKHDPRELKNHAVSDVYEPGSTFKMVTVAGAIEENLTNPDERIDCQMGSITFNGYRIHDWHPFGVLTVAGILANSSDVGAIKLALRLGPERFYKYIKGFGFGTRTGIELPGESRGMTKPVNRWSAASIGSISMGQEIAVTPIQLVSMTSAMANDGIYTPARIIAGVVAPNGDPKDVKYQVPEQHRAITPLTAAKMRSMLQGVVVAGTAKKAGLNGWTSAGKTGTAQKIDPKTHRYGSKDIASFSGFAPVNNPVVAISVVLDSPSGAHHHGGDTGAPAFGRIAQQVLQYLNVPHDSEVDMRKRIEMAKTDLEEGDSQRLGSLDFDDAAIAAMNEDNTPAANQSKVVNASYVPPSKKEPKPDLAADFTPVPTPEPASDTDKASDAAVSGAPTPVDAGAGIVVAGDGPTVPNFSGKTLRTALEEAQKSGILVQAVGSGSATQQSVAPGSHLHPGEKVVVWFRR